MYLLYQINIYFSNKYVNITSKYVNITTRLTGLKRSECLCGASELSVKKLAQGIKRLATTALGRLYQYKRLPFVTNGVSAFQRVMGDFIERHQLKKVYAYLDDLTVTGATLEEHDPNLKALYCAAMLDGLTSNEKMSRFCCTPLLCSITECHIMKQSQTRSNFGPC